MKIIEKYTPKGIKEIMVKYVINIQEFVRAYR